MPSEAREGRLPHHLSLLLHAACMNYLRKARLSQVDREATSGSNLYLVEVLWSPEVLWVRQDMVFFLTCTQKASYCTCHRKQTPPEGTGWLLQGHHHEWKSDAGVLLHESLERGQCHHSLLEREETAGKEKDPHEEVIVGVGIWLKGKTSSEREEKAFLHCYKQLLKRTNSSWLHRMIWAKHLRENMLWNHSCQGQLI